jgi:outer membrane receptor for ferric coprogen and ferric-rhodotorulic acid
MTFSLKPLTATVLLIAAAPIFAAKTETTPENASEKITTLEPIDVVDSKAKKTNEKTDYYIPHTMAGTKTDTPIFDTPMSIKIIPEDHYSLEQEFGMYDYYKTTLDATGALTDDKSLQYRFTGTYQNNNSFRDYLSNERYQIYGSLLWKISNRTEVSIDIEGLSQFNAASDFLSPTIDNIDDAKYCHSFAQCNAVIQPVNFALHLMTMTKPRLKTRRENVHQQNTFSASHYHVV